MDVIHTNPKPLSNMVQMLLAWSLMVTNDSQVLTLQNRSHWPIVAYNVLVLMTLGKFAYVREIRAKY